MDSNDIQWHPAFTSALKLELADYLDYLEFTQEHPLSSKPLQIDVVIIKKLKEIKILKNIAKIFKVHNLIEYKSPDDYLNIDDFYKVKAYAYLYKSVDRKVDEIKLDELTITMVASKFPHKMINQLQKTYQLNPIKISDGVYQLENTDITSQLIIVDIFRKIYFILAS